MREIKFKAFHKFKKKMLIVSKIDFLNKEVSVLKSNGEELKKSWLFCDIELLQFTGLKDKNNIEIYEGDIINFYYGLGHKDVNGNKVVGTVFWHGEDLQFQIQSIKKVYKFVGFGLVDIQIIGNIYLNPELIK